MKLKLVLCYRYIYIYCIKENKGLQVPTQIRYRILIEQNVV